MTDPDTPRYTPPFAKVLKLAHAITYRHIGFNRIIINSFNLWKRADERLV